MQDTFRFLAQDPMYEMHLIAYYYHWDRKTLQNLPAKERKRWIELIIEHTNYINGGGNKKEGTS